MLIPIENFTIFYISFLLIATVDRVISAFFHKRTKPTLHIYHKWIVFLLLSTYIFSVLLSIIEYFTKVITIDVYTSIFGILVFVTGAFLRKLAIAQLGENWSMHIEVKQNHEMICHGIYKIIKHPYYISVILELLGVCLVANAFYSLYFVFLIHLPILIIRVIIEERILGKYFRSSQLRTLRN